MSSEESEITREEFAKLVNFPVDHLPLEPVDTTWSEIYRNSCKECKSFNIAGHFPTFHHMSCPNADLGFDVGIIEILRKKGE